MSSVDVLKQAFEKAFADSEKIKPGDKVYLKSTLDNSRYLGIDDLQVETVRE